MDFEIGYLWSVVISYLLGSIPNAIIISKLFNLADPRTYGSGNPGATNVLRTGDKKAAIATLILDITKGVVAVLICNHLFPNLPVVGALACFFAVVGHIYPVWLRFKGGKGVATALGVLLAYQPLIAVLVLVVFFLIGLIFRYVSLASIISTIFAVLIIFVDSQLNIINDQINLLEVLFILAMGTLLIFRHHQNINRLIKGVETKF